MRRWLLSRLPDGDDKAKKTAFEDRRIEITPDRDGMTDLYAYLPTEVAEALFTARTLARTNTVPDDTRTLAPALRRCGRGPARRADGGETTVAVVLPTSGIGATVNGCPLPWTNAWHLACRTDPTWFAWLATPPAGSSTPPPRQYRIPPPWPAPYAPATNTAASPAAAPATRCDLDHTIPHPDGDTTADNLHRPCRRHHRIKHQTGWHVVNIGDNELEWTSPPDAPTAPNHPTPSTTQRNHPTDHAGRRERMSSEPLSHGFPVDCQRNLADLDNSVFGEPENAHVHRGSGLREAVAT